MSARALMVLGTASHVGKSLLTAAFCRILAQSGVRVAPFKAQNMSLESAATPEGHEIGRAQALQAEAADIAPSVDMNPVLLKPMGERRSQVVLLGKIWGDVDAYAYHRIRVAQIFPSVLAAYERLAAAYDAIVLEGAGSPAEINLKNSDIVNMRMAQAADARCVLVGDIDRGGVFASLLGTLELLEPHERARVHAFIINKFRGDRSLLNDGIAQIERRLGIPCAGVVPWLPNLALEDEDSLSLAQRPRVAQLRWEKQNDPQRPLRVAAIAFPHLANFSDFDALGAEPSVQLGYAHEAAELEFADLIILPGSKATLADLAWLRAQGLAAAIARRAGNALILGICGGMQMLGTAISDPGGIEGGGQAEGLGLLSLSTVLEGKKITRRVRGRFAATELFGTTLEDVEIDGYEIHVGRSVVSPPSLPLLSLTRSPDGQTLLDGAIAPAGRIAGTYVHGLFGADAARHAILQAARIACALAPANDLLPITAHRSEQINMLAAHVGSAVDMRLLFPNTM